MATIHVKGDPRYVDGAYLPGSACHELLGDYFAQSWREIDKATCPRCVGNLARLSDTSGEFRRAVLARLAVLEGVS